MQKSRKLMVSLCGLALSSLFVVNSKSVVHADAVNDANNQNNNAISWDSDSDAAQQVQNDSEQSSVQNTQVADDHQQNQVSNVQSYAETSTVRSSSEAPRITNQNAAVQSPHVANVQDAQASNPIVINNPAGDKINVHYVNHDGGAITDPNVKDTTIDVTKTGQGSYQVPSGYNVNNPDGKYTISGGAFNGASLKGNTWTVPDKYSKVLTTGNDLMDTALTRLGMMKDGTTYSADASSGNHQATVEVLIPTNGNDVFNGYKGYRWLAADGNVGTDGVTYIGGGTWYTDPGRARGPYNEQYYFGAFSKSPSGSLNILVNESPHKDVWNTVHSENKLVESAHIEQQLPVAFVDSNNNIVGMVQNYTGKVGTTQNVSLTVPTGYKLADGASLPTSVTFQNSTDPLLVKVVPSGKTQSVTNPANNTINVKFVDQESGQQVGTDAIDLTKAQSGTNYYNAPAGYGADHNEFINNIKTKLKYTVTGTSIKDAETTVDPMEKEDIALFNSTLTNEDMANMWADLKLPNESSYDLVEASMHAGVPSLRNDAVEIWTDDDQYEISANASKRKTWEQHFAEVAHKIQDNQNASGVQGEFFVDVTFTRTPQIDTVTFTDNLHEISGNTVTVPVHKTNSFSFADNSGNVQSVNGNTVDVTLTKPQSVNPATDTRCQSQATRTIQINFPDGQIPQSYDGIVDKSGKLVQTVHFTRTATEDALTGNILQYGSWTSDNQDHNFIGFPERTLPRIPGYTLSIKPA